MPEISAYEKQKQIKVVNGEDDVALSEFSLAVLPDSALWAFERDPVLARSWHGFFGRRLKAVAAGTLLRLTTLFPGHTVPGPGSAYGTPSRYRGSLLFEQFLKLLSFDGCRPSVDHFLQPENIPAVKLSPVPLEVTWPWTHIRKPSLFYVSADGCEHCAQYKSDSPGVLLQYLDQQLSLLVKKEKLAAQDVLPLIHRAWTGSDAPQYVTYATDICNRLLSDKRWSQDRCTMLPLLFELEGFASYVTFAQTLRPFSSGIFGGNWVEVGQAKLASCRGTELCVTERLYQEVLNLPARGFAPVVINEYGSISDGNHRVTAAWIWNILHAAQNQEWNLDSAEFQRAVAAYLRTCSPAITDVSLHESLRNLALFLLSDERRGHLEQKLKPMMKIYQSIDELPAVLLPEYSAASVEKEAYDAGLAVKRVQPSIYETMAKVPNSVLPPRASYHFTDCAVLPWFQILTPTASPATGGHSHRHMDRTSHIRAV